MMNKFLVFMAQVFFVLILDGLVVGWIYIESEKWKEIQGHAAAEAAEPEVLIDSKSGLELDSATRLVMGDGYPTIKKECVNCHPTQIIRTFRSDRAGWLDAIRWMQAEKGLKTFNEKTENTILTYLETYYGN
jgi:hypothetical protein